MLQVYPTPLCPSLRVRRAAAVRTSSRQRWLPSLHPDPERAGPVPHAMAPQVIIVDDEPHVVQLVLDLLQDEGIVADSCPYGHRAHTCIRTKQPRLAILDIQMPDVDGIELFRRLRADPEIGSLPVIFLTANAHLLSKRLPDYATQNAVLLAKPFGVEGLLDLVSRMLSQGGVP